MEVTESTYPTMADAVARGGVASGWVPSWLPLNATNLRETHDIDTNNSALAFDVPGGEAWHLPEGCRQIEYEVVVPPRPSPSWWPDQSALGSAYTFYTCLSDVPPTSVFVGVRHGNTRGLHWRVTAR